MIRIEGEGRMLPRREMLRITAVAGLAVAFGGGLTAALLRQAGQHRVRVTRSGLGTLVTITAVHPLANEARAMVEAGFAEIERLEAILSRHRAGTPMARLNREGILREPPPELAGVLDRALAFATLSDGAFDPTVAPLLALVRDRIEATGSPPDDAEVRAVLTRVDHRAVRVDGAGIAFERPGMALTLDGIAKGHVVDRAAAALLAAGAERILVDIGGDMASAGGEPGGDRVSGGAMAAADPWKVAIQDPRAADRRLDVLRLRGDAVATSGDYVQAFTDDLRHHHIVDPRTGRSPAMTSGVTVVAPTAMDADALSTAAFVLGPADGLALLERIDGVEGLIVDKDGSAFRTRGFDRHTT